MIGAVWQSSLVPYVGNADRCAACQRIVAFWFLCIASTHLLAVRFHLVVEALTFDDTHSELVVPVVVGSKVPSKGRFF